MKEEMKLTGKDLVNIGIYTAILFVLNFVAMFTGIVPILWIVLPGTTGILTAIPFALMNLKVKKPGAVLIMGAVAADYVCYWLRSGGACKVPLPLSGYVYVAYHFLYCFLFWNGRIATAHLAVRRFLL